MRTGQRSYIPGAGYIVVDSVEEVALDDLTDEDARLDGFPTLAALLDEIESLYRDEIEQGYRAYRVRFRRVETAGH